MEKLVLPRVVAYIRASGATHPERARRFGVSRATIISYLKQETVPPTQVIANDIGLAEAFCADVQERFGHFSFSDA